ncbi:MAG: aldehyde dehydrogenase family protein [Kutzneria sp.]|nr:aldehyde dehydrogenase family protein [Kutzneria sp.]MBV9843487.1 aldehyde dehydrogenase family protein [Kutzneria sp.]
MDDAIEAKPRPCWIAGKPEEGQTELVVCHPYDGTEVATVSVPGPDQVQRAVAAAAAVATRFRGSPAHLRAAALAHVSEQLAARHEEIAETITAENGKPLKWAVAEVNRAISTFRFAAEEARRFTGELQRLDTEPAAEGRLALVRRVARGPVLGIAPFNFPLNLVAHKVAPAIAVGAPIVIKPAPRTPLSALILGELLAETDLPEGAFSVLPVGNDETMALVRDERLPVVSFTGSGPVGWSIMDAAPRKHVVLELGGNAAAVVASDWCAPADLDFAAERIALFSNYQAGQSCIAVQRVIVAASVADELLPRLANAVRALHTGDPHDPKVEVGPMVDSGAAERVRAWIDQAVADGAELVVGGGGSGTTVEPTMLTGVPATAKVWTEEVFGPVLAVSIVDDMDAAFASVNSSSYGLQAGLFTHDLQLAFRAATELEVGGLIVGDVPSYRADQMPYGGLKASGVGREGLRSAMADFTEERTMVLTGIRF